jgi:hypothetical protein
MVPHELLRETLAEYPTLGGDHWAMVEDLTRGGRGAHLYAVARHDATANSTSPNRQSPTRTSAWPLG